MQGDLESVAKATEAAKGMSFAKDGIDVVSDSNDDCGAGGSLVIDSNVFS